MAVIIEGKICPIRKPVVEQIIVNKNTMEMQKIETERRCTRDCAMFSEFNISPPGAEKVFSQYCKMWPGDE